MYRGLLRLFFSGERVKSEGRRKGRKEKRKQLKKNFLPSPPRLFFGLAPAAPSGDAFLLPRSPSSSGLHLFVDSVVVEGAGVMLERRGVDRCDL